MSSGQQVWHTAMPPPGRSSPTAPVPRSPGSASGPTSPGSATSPTSPGSATSPTSPGSASGPTSPGLASGPRSPRSASGPTSPGLASGPMSPGSASGPRSPSSATSPTSPGSASGPTSPGLASGPRTPRSATSPTSPGSVTGPRSPGTPGTPGSEKVASPLECSICFSGYDNIFKTPKELSCTHVFCLECLARLAAAQPTGRLGCEAVPCPFCRQRTAVPAAGAPALRTCRQLQAKMPAHLRREAPVWLEGTKLCYRPSPPAPGLAAPSFVCVDVGLRKPAEPAPAPAPAAPGPAPRRGRLARCWARCGDWKRAALATALLLVLFCVVLWPVQCALKTGNLRCLPRAPGHAATPTVPDTAARSLGPLAGT